MRMRQCAHGMSGAGCSWAVIVQGVIQGRSCYSSYALSTLRPPHTAPWSDHTQHPAPRTLHPGLTILSTLRPAHCTLV